MFSQGRSAGFSAAEAVLVLLVAASNHIAIVRVIVANALLWGNKPITEQTAGFSRCSERLRWSVAFKNKQAPREKEDDWSWEKKLRINGNRADTLGTAHLNSSLWRVPRENAIYDFCDRRAVCSDVWETFIITVEIE